MSESLLDEILLKYSKKEETVIPDNVNLIEFLSLDSVDAMRILTDIEIAYGIEFNIDDTNLDIFESKLKLKSVLKKLK